MLFGIFNRPACRPANPQIRRHKRFVHLHTRLNHMAPANLIPLQDVVGAPLVAADGDAMRQYAAAGIPRCCQAAGWASSSVK